MTPAELKKRSLRMKCRRGMLELDMLLANFFDRHFDELTDHERTLLEHVLDQEDPVLWDWFIEVHPPQDAPLNAFVLRIAASRFVA